MDKSGTDLKASFFHFWIERSRLDQFLTPWTITTRNAEKVKIATILCYRLRVWPSKSWCNGFEIRRGWFLQIMQKKILCIVEFESSDSSTDCSLRTAPDVPLLTCRSLRAAPASPSQEQVKVTTLKMRSDVYISIEFCGAIKKKKKNPLRFWKGMLREPIQIDTSATHSGRTLILLDAGRCPSSEWGEVVEILLPVVICVPNHRK
jgi:hypothetical protein